MNMAQASRTRTGLMLVEDTPSLMMLYSLVLRKAGFPPICAETGADALAKFEQHKPGVVLLDLLLPDIDGMTLLRKMLAAAPRTRIIVITADGSINKAIEATRQGAHDFLVKPLGDQRLVGTVASALKEYGAMHDSLAKGAATAELNPFFRLGTTAPTLRLREQIAAVARSNAPVFLLGERGSGKKTVARMIHQDSVRAKGPFITLNCAAFDPDDLEAELFGAPGPEPGGRRGAFQAATGGTLLIENPRDMPRSVQDRLYSILQTGMYAPSETGPPSALDLRLMCSARTHPNEDMRAGRLSEDLYYRLFVLPLVVPPLRERSADIVPFATHLLGTIAKEEGKRFSMISPCAAAALSTRSWKGNLRELMNALRHAVVLHDGPKLTEQMLPAEISASDATPTVQRNATLEEMMAGMTMGEIERRAMRAAIARHDGSIPRAARELDIAPSTIYRKRDGWTDTPH